MELIKWKYLDFFCVFNFRKYEGNLTFSKLCHMFG